MKKKILVGMALLSALSFTSCAGESAVDLVAFNNEEFSSSEIVARIDGIGEVSLEKENEIESIYIDYTALSDSEKAEVSNYNVLESARNGIARLYTPEEKLTYRFDRSQILLGVYRFPYTGVCSFEQLAEAGFDYTVCGVGDDAYLDELAKYGMGSFVCAGNRQYPVWWGLNNIVDGKVEPTFTLEEFIAKVEATPYDHEAFWGLSMVDETNAGAYPYLGECVEAYRKINPQHYIYDCQFPIYASEEQFGVASFKEYLEAYVENVNTDRITVDFYDIDKTVNDSDMLLLRHLSNLQVMAEVCRETGRELWAVMQIEAFSGKDRDYVTVGQMRTQAYTALAFGAKSIGWSTWYDGWWDPDSCPIDTEGNATPVYYSVKQVNSEIKNLSPVYMKYTNTDACFVNDISIVRRTNLEKGKYDFVGMNDNVLDQDMFMNIEVANDDALVLAGSFVKNDGDGAAILFTHVTDFFDEAEIPDTVVTFALKSQDVSVVAYYPEGAYRIYPNSDGVYTLRLKNADGVFVTVEPVIE